MAFTFLYVTAVNTKEASKIALILLRKRLIACANLFPIESKYWWKGKIANEKETVLILKTVKKKVTKVRKEIEKIHSYEIPCITEIKVKPNERYGEWLEGQIR